MIPFQQNKHRFLAVFVAVFIASSPVLSKPNESILKAAKSITYYPDSSIKQAKLHTPIVIQGIPCEQWVHFDSAGNLSQCRVARDTIYNSVILLKKTVMRFRQNVTIFYAYFPKNVFVQGISCKGRWWDWIETSFYHNGRLHGTFLSKDENIQGVPCKASLFHGVQFQENGSLSKCTLSANYSKHGKTFKKGTTINISSDGNISEDKK